MKVFNKIKFGAAMVVLLLFFVSAAGAQTNTCGSTSYNASTHFCDTRDNKIYRYVTIGSQVWMAENLNYATTSGSWCYDNSATNCNTYGRLYNWTTALTACPAGWYLPSHDEWTALISEVGVPSTARAGERLKSSTGWYDEHASYVPGTDNYDFSALPGGNRDGNSGVFSVVGYGGFWWTATEYDANDARYRRMYHYNANVDSNWDDKANGFSVRCVTSYPYTPPPSSFDPVPATGLSDITLSVWLIIIFGVVSVGLWGYVILRRKPLFRRGR